MTYTVLDVAGNILWRGSANCFQDAALYAAKAVFSRHDFDEVFPMAVTVSDGRRSRRFDLDWLNHRFHVEERT